MTELLSSKKKKKLNKQKLVESMESTTKTDQNGDSTALGATENGGDIEMNQNKSQVRSIKKRLEDESDYIQRLISYVRIPAHNLDTLDENDDDTSDEEQDLSDHAKSRQDVFVSSENRAKSHGELQERFQKKLEEIRSKKHQGNSDKLKAKLSKSMKKAEKKKKEKEAMKQTLIKAGKHSGNLNKPKLENNFEGVRAKDESKKNGEHKIVFSKFDFVEPETGLAAIKKKHMDPKAALNKINKSKEKLATMKEKGMTEKVAKIENKVAWQKAMDKAGGAKVKDDVDLLKKSLRRKEHEKKKSKRKWEEREGNVEKRKDEGQKKRQDNIKKRKLDVKDKKKKVAIKRGRLIPGL